MSNEATGVDSVPVEQLKHMRQVGHWKLLKLVFKIYTMEQILSGYMKSIIWGLLKKTRTEKYENYRTIRLMSLT